MLRNNCMIFLKRWKLNGNKGNKNTVGGRLSSLLKMAVVNREIDHLLVTRFQILILRTSES